MIDRKFWNSQLGQAAMASILAMTAMIAVSTQFHTTPDGFTAIVDSGASVELA